MSNRADSDSESLTPTEAAKLLKLSVVTVRRRAARGEIPGRKVANRWRFLRSALLELLRGKPDEPVEQ